MAHALDASRVPAAETVMERLSHDGVEAVALGFVDPSAIVRVKCIPVRHFAHAARAGIGLSTVFAVALSNDEFTSAPGYVEGPSGDLRLVPDPDATVQLVASLGWGWAPVDQFTQEGEPWEACPRTFLRRIVERLGERGLHAKTAFESEYSLGRETEDGDAVPAHFGPGYSSIVLAQHDELVLDMIRVFDRQGLDVQQVHPEYSNGQFEVSVAPLDPLAMADALLVLRQTARAVAKRYGYRASFSPRTFGAVGNGMHLHLSIWDAETNLLAGGDGPVGMQATGEAFVAGILRELPALVAVTCPSPISYLRLQPHHWSGAMQCWGLENREAALRSITGMKGLRNQIANVEYKPIDGTCNPYLAMGAILAAGLAGIEDGLSLPPGTTEDPSELPLDEQRARGVRQLPASLPAAIGELSSSTVIRQAMGDLLFETFLATRRGDHEQYAEASEEQMIREYRWRY